MTEPDPGGDKEDLSELRREVEDLAEVVEVKKAMVARWLLKTISGAGLCDLEALAAKYGQGVRHVAQELQEKHAIEPVVHENPPPPFLFRLTPTGRELLAGLQKARRDLKAGEG